MEADVAHEQQRQCAQWWGAVTLTDRTAVHSYCFETRTVHLKLCYMKPNIDMLEMCQRLQKIARLS